MNLDIGLDRRYKNVYDEFDRVDVSDIEVIELQWFNKCRAIEEYWQQRGVDI